MLGQATASLERIPRRWLQRVWGVFDINVRQKWRAAWCHLSILPISRVRMLDAGCGTGCWTLEIASRRSGWYITGIDNNAESLRAAEASRRHLGLNNALFVEADFRDFRPDEPFDVILAIGSAHYLAEAGRGTVLFQNFASWLRPHGFLILLSPRRKQDVPTCQFLPPIPSHTVFSYEDLDSLCRASGLKPEGISPLVGRLGTAAKQISNMGAGRSLAIRAVSYPLQVFLDLFDRWSHAGMSRRSASWLLIAKKAAEAT
jgi:SAM-dependent methyltransferase